ncbi:ATP-binding protein [Vibrio parahaemolyticus]|nr:ATP-binding protein [Vibrio parahaemolyticus]
MSKLIYNSLLAFNKKGDKCFYSKFCNGINIVYGRNTSGKSTLLQLLNYAMGINDSKENLSDVLKEGVVIRLDATLNDKRKNKKINFVRDNSSLIVNIEGESIQRFDGINGNSSYEYRRYKEFFSSLINFNLELESKGEIHPAPLEAAFLPFYISQSVGWVYLRESIGNYRFYKNFKDDYLDYYFNLTNNLDREKIFKLKEDRKQYSQEINFVERYHINHPEIKVAQAISERFKSGAYAYIEEFNQRNEEVIINQKKHIDLVNKKINAPYEEGSCW